MPARDCFIVLHKQRTTQKRRQIPSNCQQHRVCGLSVSVTCAWYPQLSPSVTVLCLPSVKRETAPPLDDVADAVDLEARAHSRHRFPRRTAILAIVCKSLYKPPVCPLGMDDPAAVLSVCCRDLPTSAHVNGKLPISFAPMFVENAPSRISFLQRGSPKEQRIFNKETSKAHKAMPPVLVVSALSSFQCLCQLPC